MLGHLSLGKFDEVLNNERIRSQFQSHQVRLAVHRRRLLRHLRLLVHVRGLLRLLLLQMLLRQPPPKEAAPRQSPGRDHPLRGTPSGNET